MEDIMDMDKTWQEERVFVKRTHAMDEGVAEFHADLIDQAMMIMKLRRI